MFKKGMSDIKKEIDARLNNMEAKVPHIPISRLTISGGSEEEPSTSSSAEPRPTAKPVPQPVPQPIPQPVPQPVPQAPLVQATPVAPVAAVAPTSQVQSSSETILTIPRICKGKITGAYSLDLKELLFK